jgi:hypothetical protein
MDRKPSYQRGSESQDKSTLNFGLSSNTHHLSNHHPTKSGGDNQGGLYAHIMVRAAFCAKNFLGYREQAMEPVGVLWG